MNLTSEVQGRIEEIYVKEGDVVTKGQPLATLVPDNLQAAVALSEATLTAREADVISTRIHLDRSGLLDAADFEKYFGCTSRRTRRATQLQSK